MREKESPDEKEEKNKRRRDQQRAVRVNTDHIADLTQGNVRTPKWKVPGKDFHVEGHTSHPEAAMLLLYLSAGIGWNDECKWCVAFIHVYDRLTMAKDWDGLHRLCSLMFVGLERRIAFRTEQLRKLGKDYHMLPRLVQPNMGVFIRRGCETKQRCSNGTT